jgi:Zn-dependent peptidase ImmA (M78 family)
MARAKKSKISLSDLPAATLSILGNPVPILLERVKPDKEDIEAYGPNAFICGQYVETRQCILIHPNHPKETLQNTVLHEVLHSIFHISGMSSITNEHPGLEEALVRALTSALLPAIDLSKLALTALPQVIPTNPELIK